MRLVLRERERERPRYIIISFYSIFSAVMHVAGISTFLYFYFEKDQKYQIQWSFFAAAGSAVITLMACILFWVHVFYTGCYDT